MSAVPYALVYRPGTNLAVFLPGGAAPAFTLEVDDCSGATPESRSECLERVAELMRDTFRRAGVPVEFHRVEEKPLFPRAKDA